MRLFLALLLTSSAAQAQVYKCEVKGRTTYTDKPCNKDAVPMDFSPLTRIDSTRGEKELAKDWDQRVARDKKARDKADKQWIEQHDAASEKAERIRKGRVENKIVKGMTQEQVREVAGEPDKQLTQEGKDVQVEIWSYKPDSGPQRTVSFKNGEVINVTTSKSKKKRK